MSAWWRLSAILVVDASVIADGGAGPRSADSYGSVPQDSQRIRYVLSVSGSRGCSQALANRLQLVGSLAFRLLRRLSPWTARKHASSYTTFPFPPAVGARPRWREPWCTRWPPSEAAAPASIGPLPQCAIGDSLAPPASREASSGCQAHVAAARPEQEQGRLGAGTIVQQPEGGAGSGTPPLLLSVKRASGERTRNHLAPRRSRRCRASSSLHAPRRVGRGLRA